MSKIKIGSDFSGVGAFNQALNRLGIEYDELFACDLDKYARQTFELNYGKPKDFPKDVYEREIPKLSLDIYMTSPPCQAFSMAGKRMGKDDQRGILFFNSLEFIKENKPRYFIFENVKGLLSHYKQDKNAVYGRTFQEWINYLGGKSVNGVHTFFPYQDSVPYHIYFQVLNAKHYGIPQNRERVFIIGIRDDEDNDFQFPKKIPLEKRLKDVLESEVDEKYFLSDKMVNYLKEAPRSLPFTEPNDKDIANCILANQHKMSTDQDFFNVSISKTPEAPIVEYQLTGGKWDKTHEQSGRVYDKEGISPTIHTMGGGNQEPKIAIGAFRGRNPENSSDRTTGANLKQTLEINESGTSNALTSVQKDNVVVIGEIINPLKDKTEYGWHFEQAVYDSEGITRSLKSTEGSGNKPKVVINSNTSKGFDEAEEEEDSINFSVPSSKTRRGRVGKKVSQTLDTQCNQGIFTQQRIRRLTPTEAFRLMDFNEDMIEKTINAKKHFYFQFIYSNFDINKKETICDVKLKIVKETQTLKSLETYVLCTTKECQEMDQLRTLRQKRDLNTKNKENLRNVNFAIEPLVELVQKECVINITKWIDCTEIHCIETIKKTNQVVVDISDITMEKDCIEPLWKITLEENLSEEKLFITLILLKQIMISKIYTYVEMHPNTQRYISSIVDYEKKSGKLQLSYLKMDSTKQLISDSMLYKQAGNSICVGILAAIISKLKF